MIVNLYVDHLASTPPQSAEDVWNDTRENPRVYAEAAERIGLSKRDYAEFRQQLLDGKAVYVQLPLKVDSMAGVKRSGHVYAVKDALMTTHVMGWRVRLHDGVTVYVPQTCGNLSIVHATPRRVAAAPVYISKVAPAAFAAAPIPAPVIVGPPDIPPLAAPIEAPVAAPAAVSSHNETGLLAIPVVAGLIYGVTHLGGGGGSTVPPCSAGSNAQFACQK